MSTTLTTTSITGKAYDGLNELVADFNEQYPNDAVELYEESDLNKIAI